MIKPTIGRVVWYHPDLSDMQRFPNLMIDTNGEQPHAAMIVHVWSDTCVNLVIYDKNGVPFNRTSVYLRQPDVPKPEYAHCEWMPFQIGQAAK